MSEEIKEQEEQQSPRVIIEFVEEGSANFSVRMVGTVYPTQLLALANYLKIMGESAVAQQEIMRIQQLQQQKIAQPERGIIIPKMMDKKQ